MNYPQTANIVASLQDIANLRQEHFVCFTLDSSQRIIAKHIIFIGTLTGVLAHPREIFAVAVEDRAAAIVVAHNHPSGDPSPSETDISMTQQLVAAGQILGIPLDDHIIVSNKEHLSFRQQSLILPDAHYEN